MIAAMLTAKEWPEIADPKGLGRFDSEVCLPVMPCPHKCPGH